MFQNGFFLAACLMTAGMHHVGTISKLTMEFMKVSPFIQAAYILQVYLDITGNIPNFVK